MARGDRKADLKARIGLEDLEGRNLQSALVGGVVASAPLIRPTAASASAYHTTVWSGSGEGLGTRVDDDGFAKIKFGSATVQSEFTTIKGESATVEVGFDASDEEPTPTEDRKSTPILF